MLKEFGWFKRLVYTIKMNALWDKFYLNKYDSHPHPGMIKAFNETMAIYNTLSLETGQNVSPINQTVLESPAILLMTRYVRNESGSLSTNGTPVILVVEHLRDLDQQFDFEKYDDAHQIHAFVLFHPSALEAIQIAAPKFDTDFNTFKAQTDMSGLFVSPYDKLFSKLTSRFDRFGASWFDDR